MLAQAKPSRQMEEIRTMAEQLDNYISNFTTGDSCHPLKYTININKFKWFGGYVNSKKWNRSLLY